MRRNRSVGEPPTPLVSQQLALPAYATVAPQPPSMAAPVATFQQGPSVADFRGRPLSDVVVPDGTPVATLTVPWLGASSSEPEDRVVGELRIVEKYSGESNELTSRDLAVLLEVVKSIGVDGIKVLRVRPGKVKTKP